MARELYVDSTVNLVNPSGLRKSTIGKVKPGQMNLFHPTNQQNLRVSVEQIQGMKPASRNHLRQSSTGGRSHQEAMEGLETIADIMNDEASSPQKMRNREMQKKTEAVQKEFEQLMGEVVERRHYGGVPSRRIP